MSYIFNIKGIIMASIQDYFVTPDYLVGAYENKYRNGASKVTVSSDGVELTRQKISEYMKNTSERDAKIINKITRLFFIDIKSTISSNKVKFIENSNNKYYNFQLCDDSHKQLKYEPIAEIAIHYFPKILNLNVGFSNCDCFISGTDYLNLIKKIGHLLISSNPYENAKPLEPIPSFFREKFDAQELTDITFEVKGQADENSTIFKAHKMFLCMFIEIYLKSLSSSGMSESATNIIKLDFDAKDFELFLAVLYGKKNIGDLSCKELITITTISHELFAADTLKENFLKAIVSKLSDDNFLDVYNFSIAYEVVELKNYCLKYAKDNPSIFENPLDKYEGDLPLIASSLLQSCPESLMDQLILDLTKGIGIDDFKAICEKAIEQKTTKLSTFCQFYFNNKSEPVLSDESCNGAYIKLMLTPMKELQHKDFQEPSSEPPSEASSSSSSAQ